MRFRWDGCLADLVLVLNGVGIRQLNCSNIEKEIKVIASEEFRRMMCLLRD